MNTERKFSVKIILAAVLTVILTSTAYSNSLMSIFESSIAKEIQQSLNQHKDLGLFEVEIYVRGGHVTLRGSADSIENRDKIAQIALDTRGAKSVRNYIHILDVVDAPRSNLVKLSDLEVLKKIRESLSDYPIFKGIEVSVNQGKATLSGSLADFEQIDRALTITLMVEGVKDIKSDMTVKGSPYPIFTR